MRDPETGIRRVGRSTIRTTSNTRDPQLPIREIVKAPCATKSGGSATSLASTQGILLQSLSCGLPPGCCNDSSASALWSLGAASTPRRVPVTIRLPVFLLRAAMTAETRRDVHAVVAPPYYSRVSAALRRVRSCSH